jgi:hypothetical protein
MERVLDRNGAAKDNDHLPVYTLPAGLKAGNNGGRMS